jgi:hypothetical protein
MLLFFVSLIFIIPYCSQSLDKSKLQEKQRIANLSPAQKHQEDVAKQFSPWNGSNYSLENYIKTTMKNPDSYEHVSTKYVDKGTYLIITTAFRGANSFGAMVTNSITAKVSLNGTILYIIQ